MSKLSESDYFIRKLNRNSLFYSDRRSFFSTLDDKFNVIKVEEISHLDSDQIYCDGCNTPITTKEIISMFYLNDKSKEVISRAECEKCYNEYFKDIPIVENPLFNFCSEILYDKQAREYKGVLIDLQTANMYCFMFSYLNHGNRIDAENMESVEYLMIKLWNLVGTSKTEIIRRLKNNV